jgi:hypothetical protein
MTKFNPDNKHRLTYGEALGPAMKITDKEDAKQYFEKYVEYLDKANKEEGNEVDAKAIAKTNLGYYAGYYDPETYARVMNLYDTVHPFFGKEWPTPQNAFNIGIMKGTEAREKREYESS